MTADQWLGAALLAGFLGLGFAFLFGNWKWRRGYPDEGDPAPVAMGIPPAHSDSGPGSDGGSTE